LSSGLVWSGLALSSNTSLSGDVESLQLAVERERSFKLDRSALSSGVVVEGNVAEKDEDNQDGIRFAATLNFRFENKETVTNWLTINLSFL